MPDPTNKKNTVENSNISAGGNVHIGDVEIHTESRGSRRLRWFLYLFVPLVTISAAVFWWKYQQMRTPLTLTVALDDRTPNPELPFSGATVQLSYGEKTETLDIRTEADFKGIAAFRGEKLRLRFSAPGFFPVDTVFTLDALRLELPIFRDGSFGYIAGFVRDENGRPLAGAQIRVQDLTTLSQTDGSYALDIPFGKQRPSQRVNATLHGYKPWDFTNPVLKGEEIQILLRK